MVVWYPSTIAQVRFVWLDDGSMPSVLTFSDLGSDLEQFDDTDSLSDNNRCCTCVSIVYTALFFSSY